MVINEIFKSNLEIIHTRQIEVISIYDAITNCIMLVNVMFFYLLWISAFHCAIHKDQNITDR